MGGCSSENSHRIKLLVSRRLRSPVRCNPSPISPPFPTLRPALSFFFLAVRTLLKWISMFRGNWRAGRWKERASCFDSRVLYCGRGQYKVTRHWRRTYEGELQLLCRIRVLDDELSECLTHPMAAAFFRHFVELVVREVELVLRLIVCA